MKNLKSIIFLIFILFVLLNMANGYKSAAIRARQKACFNNVATLQSIYDMEDLNKLNGVNANGYIHTEKLAKLKLIPKELACPFEGKFIATSSQGMFQISCSFHGISKDNDNGNLDPGYSIFYWLYKWIRGIF